MPDTKKDRPYRLAGKAPRREENRGAVDLITAVLDLALVVLVAT